MRPKRRLAAVLLGVLLAVAHAAAVGAQAASDHWAVDLVKARAAWERTRGDGVTVAVVDTGVDPDHPALRGRLVPGRDFTTTGDADTRDLNGHGTHVAGIIAADGDVPGPSGRSVTGAAPGAKIMPVRVLRPDGEGSSEAIAEGVKWAVDNGAQVVNLSLGGSGVLDLLSPGGPIDEAVRYAASNGAVVIAASGNDDRSGEEGVPELRTFDTDAPVLIVNAVDATGQPTEFTNFGDPNAVAAPGLQILSTIPTYPTTGHPDPGDGYAPLDGTSMATPFVAAQAALLLAAGQPAATVPDVIRSTAVKTGDDPRLGAGVVDFVASLAVPVASSVPATDGAVRPPVGVVVLIALGTFAAAAVAVANSRRRRPST